MRIWILLVVLLASPAAAQLDVDRVTELEAQIAERTNDGAPGVAVGIVRDGEIIYEHYAGLANLEHAVPVGPRTRFNIASNAKQFTALCALDLARAGSFGFEDDIRTYIPELFGDVESTITIADCIDHSSGIRDVYDLWSLQGRTWWRNFFDNDDVLEMLAAQRDLNFEPGSDHLYSNSNYILLAEIIARTTGESFSDRANALFQRLGMPDTSFLTNYMRVIPNRARPYADWNGWREYPSISELHGDGGLYTTLPDQLTWERSVQTMRAPGLDPDVIAASQRPVEGNGVAQYGFGVEFGSYRGLDSVTHDGSTGAYNASFIRLPGERLAVVVLSNHGGLSPYQLARDYADAALDADIRERPPHPGRPAALESRPADVDLLGVYVTVNGTVISITERDGDLYREIPQRDPVRLLHEEGNLFQYESNAELKLAFSADDRGLRTFTIYYPLQAPIAALRLTAAAVAPTDPGEWTGRYRNDETGVEMRIEHSDDEQISIILRDNTTTATVVTRDLLLSGPFRLHVSRGADDDRVQSILLDGDRIRRVNFRRVSD